MSILGPEYLEDQLVGGPSHEPRRNAQGLVHDLESPLQPAFSDKFSQEMTLAQNFENSDSPSPSNTNSHVVSPTSGRTLTPSEALRIKHQHLSHISNLAAQFSAKIVDVSENSVILEMSGKSSRVDAFLRLIKPFGLIESARSGMCSFLRCFYISSGPIRLVADRRVLCRCHGHASNSPPAISGRR